MKMLLVIIRNYSRHQVGPAQANRTSGHPINTPEGSWDPSSQPIEVIPHTTQPRLLFQIVLFSMKIWYVQVWTILYTFIHPSQVVLVVKNLPANAGRAKKHRLDPWVKKIALRRAWLQYSCLENSLQYSCLEKSHEQRSLEGYGP